MNLVLAHPRADRSSPRDALPILTALFVLLAWDFSGLDWPLTLLYGSAQGFAWRNLWLTAGLLHDGSRWLGWIVFGFLVVGVWRPLPFARALTRRERVWWLATTLVCVALIPVLKHSSQTSCPWSLAEFGGGFAHYVPHWVLWQHDGGPGRCFPSGHASTAFAFLAGWFALRRKAPRAAKTWLAITVIAGVALGWVQMMRGAHYASHTLWTAWICWAVTALSYHGSRAWRDAGVEAQRKGQAVVAVAG
jgi:membrane-associated PAP2 superfamily phosphatase